MPQQLVDITTTAVLRPEILDRTFASFKEKLFRDHPVRLIINIDNVGSETATIEDVQAVARKYFDNIVFLTQDIPNQNLALKQCWERVETDCFFNLEDDWELLVPLDLADMVDIMRSNPKLAALRLPWRSSTDTHCKVYMTGAFDQYFLWNGRYYERPRNGIPGRFGGLPSLLRTDWMRAILPIIKPGVAVEYICAHLALSGYPSQANWEWGAYTLPNTPRTIVDIGTQWRRDAGFARNSNRTPTTWVRQKQ